MGNRDGEGRRCSIFIFYTLCRSREISTSECMFARGLSFCISPSALTLHVVCLQQQLAFAILPYTLRVPTCIFFAAWCCSLAWDPCLVSSPTLPNPHSLHCLAVNCGSYRSLKHPSAGSKLTHFRWTHGIARHSREIGGPLLYTER